MKTNSIFLNDLIIKFILGIGIFIFYGVSINNIALASSLKFLENNSNNLEEIDNFSLKLNQNIYNQLEREILKQQADFSEYINLIEHGLNKNKYRFKIEDSILVKSKPEREEKLLEYFVSSLRKLEFESFSSNSSARASILVLPQVSYGDVYKGVYDFEISLGDNSPQIKNLNRSVPRNTFTTPKPQEQKYFTSHFQENKNSDYLSLKNQVTSISNTSSSLLASPQQNSSLANLTSSFLIDLPVGNNQREFPVLQQGVADVGNQNDVNYNNTNSQLNNNLQAVYLPSTQVEIYQLKNLDIPSNLNTYQKSEHQEEIDKILEKQKEKIERQREKMYQKLAKLREKREKARQKQQEKYRKQRQKALTKAMSAQQKLQQQRQRQLR